jgi:multiple sugar transport system permease protein
VLNKEVVLQKEKTFNWSKLLVYICLIIIAIMWVTPIYFSFLTAFKSMHDYANQSFYELPTSFAFFNNVKEVFKQYRFGDHVISSLIYMIGAGFLCIVFSCLAAYGIVRLKPKGNFLIFMLIYSGTIFPFQMYLIPLFKFYNNVGLYNTRLGMILLFTAITIPFALFVYRGFFVTIPRAIEDAAKIDGSGPFKTFFLIFVPQATAPTAVVMLFQWSWIWNDLLFGMVLTRSNEIRPIMVALASMSGIGGCSITLQMTGMILTSIPTIILFHTLKKYFIEGISGTTLMK